MTEQIIVALIAFLGTLLGTLGGIMASSKLTNYRIEQLEKKMDVVNTSVAKIPVIEADVKNLKGRVKHLEEYHEEKV